MSKTIRQRRLARQRKGSIVVIALLMLMIFLAAAAISVDVAYIQLVQTQLRSATDASAQAAVETIAEGKTVAQARAVAKRIASLNKVAGNGLVLEDGDIRFGRADAQPGGRYSFAEGGSPINGVRVNGRRTGGSPGGSVPTLFGRMVGLAQFEPTKLATAAIEERDIIIVVDRSGSMGRLDAQHPVTGAPITRLQALQFAVGVFRDVVDDTPANEQLGLVSYSDTVTAEADLNSNYGEFDSKMAGLRAQGYTDIGLGIREGADVIKGMNRRPYATPVIIVMTDGRHNRTIDPVTATRNAMNDDDLGGLVVHAVTFSAGADRERMQNVADEGQGKYLHADDTGDLIARFEELARTAGTLLIE